MAIIRHLPTSRFWIAQFARKLPDGTWKTISRSTKIPIEPPPGSGQTAKELREAAQEIATTYERTANQKLKATHIRRVLAELSNKTLRLPSVREWIEERLSLMAKTKKEATYRNYSDATRLYFEWLKEKDALPLDSITSLMMDEFQNWLDSRFRPSTRKKHFSAIRHFFSTAKKLNLLDTDPCEAVTHLSSLSRTVSTEISRRPFTTEELQLILTNSNEEWHSMILCSPHISLPGRNNNHPPEHLNYRLFYPIRLTHIS